MGEQIKLEPCPFCGAQPKMKKSIYGFWVHCDNCLSSGVGSDVEETAAAAWNRRAPAPAGDDKEMDDGNDRANHD